MKLRVARHTTSLVKVVAFYTDNLGLEVLGQFKSHKGYDGTFVGQKNADWHLEFTVSDELPVHSADEDDLLVFYVDTAEEFNRIKANFDTNNILPIEPKNPYWNKNALCYLDPDDFGLVISLRN